MVPGYGDYYLITHSIHNLAYQGVFSRDSFRALHLPEKLWSSDGLEFYDQLSFIKGGLVYADHITTVSPTYATEIQTPEFGNGLDGLLRHRSKQLTGILSFIGEWKCRCGLLITTNDRPQWFTEKLLGIPAHWLFGKQ